MTPRHILILSFMILFMTFAMFCLIFQSIQKKQSEYTIEDKNGKEWYRTQKDQNGVTHIYASDVYQAVYAQGYTHAQQRLFQMDVLRRAPQGMMSQILGEKTLYIDKYMRTVGIKRNIEGALETLTEYQKDILTHYSRGVNDFVKQMKMHPLEYWITWTEFKEWKIQDSLAITKMMQYSMTFDFQIEILKDQLKEIIGKDLMEKLYPNGEDGFFWGTDAYIMSDDELKQSGFYVEKPRREDDGAVVKGSKKSQEKSGNISKGTSEVSKDSTQTEKQMEIQIEKQTEKKSEEKKEKQTKENSQEKTEENTEKKMEEKEGKNSEKNKQSKKSTQNTKKSKPKSNQKKPTPKNDPPPVDPTVNGSNCWAVHGNYTESGKPMVMSDPHLNNGVPSIQFVVQINIDGNYSFGFSPPGIPGVFLARTKTYSISFTSMVADTADLFFQKVNFQKQEYFKDKQWHKLKKFEQKIQIKGKSPITLTVYQTKNGPLINQHLEALSKLTSYSGRYHNVQTPISLAWSGNKAPIDNFELGTKHIANPEKLDTGEKLVKQFQKNYNGVSFSACFATANGDIGYVGLAKQPIRNTIFGANQIQDGTNSKSQWTGFLEQKQLPYLINPEKGFVSCSNQRIASDHLRHRITGNTHPMSRAVTQTNKLNSMIKSGKKITIEDMIKLQGNVFDEYGYEIKKKMTQLTLYQINNSDKLKDYKELNLFKKARDILEYWDGYAYKDSKGASIYYVWEQKMWELCLDQAEFDSIQEKLSYFKGFFPEQWLMKSFKEWANYRNFDDPICGTMGCDELIIRSLQKAVDYLKQKFGYDTDLWKWGHLHRMHFKHVFSQNNVMKPLFHKSYASDGSRRTLNVALYSTPDSGFDGVHSANIRMISQVDGQDAVDNKTKKYKYPSYWTLDMGVSGVKGTSHYCDLIERHKELDFIEMKYNMPEKKSE